MLEYFEKFGIPTCDTDKLARDVISPGSEGQLELAKAIGDDYFRHGILNRAKLRRTLFQEHQLKSTVESIIHPRVKEAVEKWRLKPVHAPYQILASPLLLETNQHFDLDGIIVVDVTPKIQVERASKRDGEKPGAIKQIIQTQMSREERLSYANFIIENSGSVQALEHQVKLLHRQITND